MPIKRCGGGCGGFERVRVRVRGHNDTENKKGILRRAFFDTAYGGTRRTVCCCEAREFVGLVLSGFFSVPHRVAIDKSASYGALRNQIG